jgi:hypothetical protein
MIGDKTRFREKKRGLSASLKATSYEASFRVRQDNCRFDPQPVYSFSGAPTYFGKN